MLPADGGAAEMEDAGPEEQAAYDEFVRNGMQTIYPDGEDDPVAPKIIAGLKAADQPVMSLATTAVAIVKGLVDSANRAGQQIADEIVFHGGRELLEQLADIADAAQIHDFTDEEMEGAWYQAIDLYREQATQSGQIDPQALKQGFGEVQQADAEGRLGQMLPGLGDRLAQREG